MTVGQKHHIVHFEFSSASVREAPVHIVSNVSEEQSALLCVSVALQALSEYSRKQRKRAMVFYVTPGSGCFLLSCSEEST